MKQYNQKKMGYWISVDLISPALLVDGPKLLKLLSKLDSKLASKTIVSKTKLADFIKIGNDEEYKWEARINKELVRVSRENDNLPQVVAKWLQNKLDVSYPLLKYTVHVNGYDGYMDEYVNVMFTPKDDNNITKLDVDCNKPSSKNWSSWVTSININDVKQLIPRDDDPCYIALQKFAEEIGMDKSDVGIGNSLSNG
jgi:hypothetical protein